jgi:hypothetical protein
VVLGHGLRHVRRPPLGFRAGECHCDARNVYVNIDGVKVTCLRQHV